MSDRYKSCHAIINAKKASSLFREDRYRQVVYFLDAPKLVLFLPICESPSLSSVSFSFFFDLEFLPVPDDGVGCADPLSRNDADTGVGACDAGVDPGVESYTGRRVVSFQRFS